MYLIGDVSPEERQHAEACAACQTQDSQPRRLPGEFPRRHTGLERARGVKDRAAEMHWTVIPATTICSACWFLQSRALVSLPLEQPARVCAARTPSLRYHLKAGPGARDLGTVRPPEEVLGPFGGISIRGGAGAVHACHQGVAGKGRAA